MSPELAQAALTLLERVQLQGKEVPAFNQVVAALVEMAKPTEEVDDD